MTSAWKTDVASDQHPEHDEDAQIAPIAAGDDLAECDGCENQKKGNIDHRREQNAADRGARNGNASEQPERQQRRQRIAVDGQSSSPVGDRRQKKPRDGRRDIAVDHLMDVPVERSERGRQFQMAEILRQP
jgi:hypothetical protein